MDKKVENVFWNQVYDLDFSSEGIHDTVSLETVKDRLLTVLFDLLASSDRHMDDDYGKACLRLTSIIKQEFEKLDELKQGDEVVSTETIVYVTMNLTTGERDTARLQEGSRIRGSVRGFIVLDTPDTSLLADDLTQYNDQNPVPVLHFGLGLLLAGTSIESKDGRASFDTDGSYVIVPLGHNPIPMRKVIQQ